jgi:hypothetical protein
MKRNRRKRPNDDIDFISIGFMLFALTFIAVGSMFIM